MLHEANIPSDSGYHSPHQTVPVHLDASSGTKVLVSTNKVLCPSSQGETLVNLPGKMDKILSQVLCEDTGHPNVKVPGQVLPLISTPRVSMENTANAASISASFSNWKPLLSPIPPYHAILLSIQLRKRCCLPLLEFPAQSMTASHPIMVDEDLEDYVCQAPTHVQHASTHDYAITSPDESLNCPRLVLMAEGQPQ